eukprot:jgi/Mesvir1/25060/Mv04405-RA.1
MEDLETPPPWCPFDADWFKNELPRIKRVIAGIPGNPNLRRYFSSCMPELLSWGDWLHGQAPKAARRSPSGVGNRAVADTRHGTCHSRPCTGSAYSRADAGRTSGGAGHRCGSHRAAPGRAGPPRRLHAARLHGSGRITASSSVQVASRTACDALKAGDSVLAVLPEHVASSPTWTPVVYATVASVVPPQVAPSSILLSTWNKGKKKYAVSLSKDGVLLKNTRDAIANTPALVTAMKWDGYVSQQATEDSASRAFQDLVAGGIPVGTRVCAMFQARREHGRVAAVDAAP